MKSCRVIVIVGLAVALLCGTSGGLRTEEQTPSEFPLKFTPVKGALNFTTPRGHEFGAMSQTGHEFVIPLPVKGKNGIAAMEDKNFLMVDADGDGKMETKITGGKPGFVTARLVYDDDTTSNYTLMIQKGDRMKGGGWVYQRYCSMTGKVAGVQVSLVDDNNNGKYDDYGLDSVIVGNSIFAAPLSKVLNLGGKLFEVTVNESGTVIKLKPFVGETGYADLASGYKCNGKLMVAVIQSGQNYFDVMASAPVLVPVGEYKVVWGVIMAGKQMAMINTGTMAPIVVTAGQTTKTNWGMPVRLEANCSMSGGKLVVGGSNLKAFGAGNEEYVNFSPRRLLPQVEVQDRTGKTIGKSAISEAC